MSLTKTADIDASFFDGQLGGAGEDDSFVDKYNADKTALESADDVLLYRTGLPELDWVDGGAPAVGGGDMVIYGRNLIQGMTFDAITITQGAASITITALRPGNSNLQVAIGTPAGGAAAVAVADGVITITPAAAGSTDDAMATAVNADAADTNGIVRATSASGGSFDAAQSAVPLVGGVGDYDNTDVIVSGVVCPPANETGATTVAKWSDTKITCTVPALTGETPARAASDIVSIVVKSDGVSSQQLAVALGA